MKISTNEPTKLELEIKKINQQFLRDFEFSLKNNPIPLTEGQMKLLFSMLLKKLVSDDDRRGLMEEISQIFLCHLIIKRMAVCYKLKINDPYLILFLCLIAESPGAAIMWLVYLDHIFNQNHLKEMDLDYFCNKVIPMGLISTDKLQELWDNQKISSGGNALDYYRAKND